MARSKRQSRAKTGWEKLPDEDLLTMRIRDLGLQIPGSPLEKPIGRLYAELDAQGIAFHPRCYLADEWLCPDKVPVIGIPFVLAHPRLKKLERRMMLEVEGGTEASCMKLLRHEAGHTLNYAYELFRRTRWRELFGPFTARYTDDYSPRPYSKRFVNHLRDNYAQSHPDEDFAETFAVWLALPGRWRDKYRGWPALRKLRYVDHLMRRIGPAEPIVTGGQTPWSASRMTSTLANYYQRKRRTLGEDFPGFFDPALQRLFASADAAGADEVKASEFLRRWRRATVSAVATWTGQRKFDIDRLLGKLIRRAEAMDLRVRKGEPEMASEVAAFVTAVINEVYRFAEDAESR